MTDVSTQMDGVALYARLAVLCPQVVAAAEARDIALLHSLDHALRSTVMAIIASAAELPEGPQAERAALIVAFDTLAQAVRLLRPKRPALSSVQGLYLAQSRKRSRKGEAA